MARYHVHGRLFVGPLNAPIRNELHSDESDDYEAMMAVARELHAKGFHVALYERFGSMNGKGVLRAILEWDSNGEHKPDMNGSRAN